MHKFITPLFISIFGLMSFSAQAGIEKGDKTISIFGALQSDDFDDTLTLSVAGGMFMSDTLEVQATLFLMDSSAFSMSNYGVNANLYIPGTNPDVVPYVGGGLLLSFVDIQGIGDDTSVGFNVQGGIKQFISESISINYQVQYYDAGDYDAVVTSVGFSIFLD